MQNSSFDRAIISDTSCLIALTDIGYLDVLKHLYKEIIITPEVATEYKKSLPDWMIIKEVKNKTKMNEIRESKPILGIGESSSIALALEIKDSSLILDDEEARKYALKLGLTIIGTVSVVGNACDRGYIKSYEKACEDLRKVNFRFSKKIQEEVKKSMHRT